MNSRLDSRSAASYRWFLEREQVAQTLRVFDSRVLSSAGCKRKTEGENCVKRIDWDWDWVRLRLRTAATTGPIVRPPGDMWSWKAMVAMMPSGDNSWLVHQNSLAVLPAETSGESRRNGRRSENFACLRIYFPSEGRCAADFYCP
jgi:hypothetical protein